MPTSAAEFHQEATAEYDAAFDWYLERSPDAALKFDAEVDRALGQIIHAPQLCRWSILYAQVLAQTVSVYSDLPGANLGRHSDCGGCPHEPEAWILEAAAVVPELVEVRGAHVSKTAKRRGSLYRRSANVGQPPRHKGG